MTENLSLKARLKDDKRQLKEKAKEIAAIKWERVQLKRENAHLRKKELKQTKEIEALTEALRIARLPKNSSNSSRPPSMDLYKPKRSPVNLREKSGKKTGGQPGHKGSTLLFCMDEPDEVVSHIPEICSDCGKSLKRITAEPGQIHQVVDISIAPTVLINHESIVKQCSCGKCNSGAFPRGVQGMVNYGPNISALVVNLSVRQYIPYGRIVELLWDLYKIRISEGTVANMLKRFAVDSEGKINEIKEDLKKSKVVGADETSATVNGRKWWMHTYQNTSYTFIGAHPSRGQVAQETFFPGGFPYSILVHDCLSMQLATPAAAHQICNVHLLRELKAAVEAHPEIEWPKELTKLIKDAIKLHKDGTTPNRTTRINNRLTKLLDQDQSEALGKIPALWKRLNKHKEKVFLFLQYPDKEVPPDNNGAERSIRNVKVKIKVSGQFNSGNGAEDYATARSVIDTAIKQSKNVHEELVKIISARFN
ncbi:IS66 family transposase [Arachidicoccus rhizosphaerae]|nr:IS66 family transposase [Arachidicoccus rhizosphaerae]